MAAPDESWGRLGTRKLTNFQTWSTSCSGVLSPVPTELEVDHFCLEIVVENAIGKTYGNLTVLAEVEKEGKNRRVLVRCSCEAATEKTVYLGNLRRASTTSCGCVKKAVKKTHGLARHRLYHTWFEMLQRCQNTKDKRYADYGGRGVTVCDRWQAIENFIADMQPTHLEGLTLDREDNSNSYSPENCRWATKTEQARNKRSNINITLNGKTQCLLAWCEDLKLNYKTVYTKIRSGKTPEQVLTT